MVTPLYAIGGVVMLFAARHYAYDLSFVAAESERVRAGRGTQPVEPEPLP